MDDYYILNSDGVPVRERDIKSMIVRQIPGEKDRFYVSSRGRAGLEHIVDTRYQEEPQDTPKIFCGCERSLIHGEHCAHIKAVLEHLKSLQPPQ